jgi:hypothetical protein
VAFERSGDVGFQVLSRCLDGRGSKDESLHLSQAGFGPRRGQENETFSESSLLASVARASPDTFAAIAWEDVGPQGVPMFSLGPGRSSGDF